MYLDPGFGSMVIQFVIAGIAAGGAYLFIIREKIKRIFMKKKDRDAETAISEEESGNDQ